MKKLEHYSAIAEAIVRLLYPHAEVVLHDLKSGKIAAIYNGLSKRKVGDDSLIEEINDFKELPDLFPIYQKTNWDGRRMRSTSATLRDQQGNPIGLLCINFDVSHWESFRHLLDLWLKVESEPAPLFSEDWREKINVYVSEYLKREGTTLKALAKEKKQELVRALHREGAFKVKNAANYVADVLDLSRATIYNYLRKMS